MVIVITIFFLITWGWLTYWVMVRPLILDSVEDEISRMKFSVEWAFIQDEPAARSEAALKLLNNLQMGRVVRLFSFGQAVVLNYCHRSEIRTLVAKERATFEASPLWIREAWQRHRVLAVKAALANSPAWWIPLAMLLLASVFSRQAEEWWNETGTATTNKLLTECPV
jgi:hypothetical protein